MSSSYGVLHYTEQASGIKRLTPFLTNERSFTYFVLPEPGYGEILTQADRREQNRADIIQAAARVIAKHGFHGMSMRKLAQATRRGLATFYNYFDSKEEVLFELQRQAFTTLVARAEQALQAVDDPQRRLLVFIQTHVQYFAEHPDVMQVLVREAAALPRAWRQEVRTLKERYFDIGRDVVQAVAHSHRGLDDRDGGDQELERATYGVFGMLNWVYGWYEPSRHGDPAHVAATLHRMAMWGLAGPGTDPSGDRQA